MVVSVSLADRGKLVGFTPYSIIDVTAEVVLKLIVAELLVICVICTFCGSDPPEAFATLHLVVGAVQLRERSHGLNGNLSLDDGGPWRTS